MFHKNAFYYKKAIFSFPNAFVWKHHLLWTISRQEKHLFSEINPLSKISADPMIS